jgi:hypothetical protein
MKRLLKIILVAAPAFVIAATVGLSTMGCDDSGNNGTGADLSMTTNPGPDMAVAHDLAQKGG